MNLTSALMRRSSRLSLNPGGRASRGELIGDDAGSTAHMRDAPNAANSTPWSSHCGTANRPLSPSVAVSAYHVAYGCSESYPLAHLDRRGRRSVRGEEAPRGRPRPGAFRPHPQVRGEQPARRRPEEARVEADA